MHHRRASTTSRPVGVESGDSVWDTTRHRVGHFSVSVSPRAFLLRKSYLDILVSERYRPKDHDCSCFTSRVQFEVAHIVQANSFGLLLFFRTPEDALVSF
uniref:Uncharacterized protein n=1 Tax=Timema tahoe TaxID=61484 RepID=A0A7R9NYS7_9NEOP|nr:unnamed protein product [Timema tahoe]